jgi:hypothetical protein
MRSSGVRSCRSQELQEFRMGDFGARSWVVEARLSQASVN